MNLLKTLGLGMYYRVRRISKAFKNWKKFGVIIFGSLFLAGNVSVLQLADAAGSLHMSIYPTNSTITLGSDKLYTAQVYNGITNITPDASVTWLASDATHTVATGTGASWVFRPTAAGTYTIRAQARYQTNPVFWADTDATLTVTGTDNQTYGVSASATTSGNQIQTGESKSYTAAAVYGTQPMTDQSTFGWVVTKAGVTVASNGTGKSYTFTPSSAGTYSVKVRGIYNASASLQKTAWSNELTLIVNPPITPPPATSLHASLYPTYSEITLGSNKTYTGQAYNGTTNITSQSTFTWVTRKAGTLIETKSFGLGNSLYTFRPTTAGTYTITMTASNNGKSVNADTPATLVVNSVQDNRNYLVTLSPAGTQYTPVFVAKTYTAAAAYGDADVTNDSTFGWEVTDAAGRTVKSSSGKTMSFSSPTAGTFRIRVRGIYYTVGIQKTAWSDYGTLIVEPTDECSLINITTGDLRLRRGDTVDINYYTQTTQGHSIPEANLVWNATGGLFNTTTHRYTATEVGDFILSATCRLNPAVTDSINIRVDRIIVDEDYLANVSIFADRTQLCLSESTGLSAQAYDQHGNPISGASYRWEEYGVGYLSGDRYSQYGARFNADNAVGTGRIVVTATWQGRTVSSGELLINVRDCSNPIPTPHFIDGSITAVTADGKPVCTDSVIIYMVRLTNTQGTSHNVRLNMTLPSTLRLLEASSASDNPGISGNMVTWAPGTMVQGESVVMTVKAQVKDEVRVGSNLQASAFVQSDENPNGFYIYSNNLKVICGTGPKGGPLPSTGAPVWWLISLGAVALGMSALTYRWLNRRMTQVI